jgi:hypothetical protein
VALSISNIHARIIIDNDAESAVGGAEVASNMIESYARLMESLAICSARVSPSGVNL